MLPAQVWASRGPIGWLVTVLGGILLVALAAQLSVPMQPVPMTLQTYAVVVVGALCGLRLASAILVGYILAAAAGLPVLADGESGLDAILGPTGGYLLGFLVAASAIGGWSERSGHRWRFAAGATVMLLGHAVILALGFACLASQIGTSRAYEFGVAPFLLGALVKSLLAALTVSAVFRWHDW